MPSIVVAGTGPHSRVVIDILESMGVTVAGVVDEEAGDEPTPVPFLGTIAAVGPQLVQQVDGFVAARGNNLVRLRLARALEGFGIAPFNANHPTAVLSRHCTIGRGVMIGPGAVVNTGAVVGDHVILNTGCIVEHDCRIGTGTNLSPRTATSGNVHMGDRVFVGTGAVFIPGIKVGDDAVVGAGAVVIRDVAPGTVVAGVPAKVLRASAADPR